MSPPPAEIPDYRGMFREAVEAARDEARHDSHADDLLAAVAKLSGPRPADPPKTPWTDWLRSSIIPVVLACIGGLTFYNHDQATTAKSVADLAKSIDVITQRLERDERETSDRVRDLVPIIRGGEIARASSELIDRQQNERIQAMAESIIQLRSTVETLSAAVSKTHEDLMIDRARRGEKESRLEATPRTKPGE